MTTDNIQPDLAKERLNASFDVEDLTNFIYGGSKRVKRKRYVQNIAIQDPYYKKIKPWTHSSHEEQFENYIAKHVHIRQTLKTLNITDDDEIEHYAECACPNEDGPFGVHSSMFTPTLRSQGTDEQQRRWLPLAETYKMFGTYAQTEMGHGTFVRGLETTATYDQQAREFVLDSPTVTSIKFWPAALGKTANHCVLAAQLYTKGQCYGLHFFLLQIRSMEDHSVLPGIECGVIGSKFGYNTNDNGYLKLNKVRMPRDNMLMRYSQVLEDGTYRRSGNPKLTYGVMVGKEPQILDYQTQQYRLFPLLSAAYAFYFAGQYMTNTYNSINEQIKGGNIDQLPQLHALSAGLKAFITYASSAGVEVCRICCGGHGYSMASGLPKIYVMAVPGITYEGENTVMLLQTARYLIKCYNERKPGQTFPESFEYIGQKRGIQSRMTSEVSFESLVDAYKHRANRLLEVAAKKMQSLIKTGKPAHEAWNLSSVQLLWAANNFVDSVQSASVNRNTQTVLRCVCQLYGIHGILENLGDFMYDGFLSGEQVDYLQNKMLELFAVIRPNAVALVDAFDYPDQILESCLGRYDGQVYQALYEYAKSAPMNRAEIHGSYYKHVKPFMDSMSADSKQLAKL